MTVRRVECGGDTNITSFFRSSFVVGSPTGIATTRINEHISGMCIIENVSLCPIMTTHCSNPVRSTTHNLYRARTPAIQARRAAELGLNQNVELEQKIGTGI